MHVRADGRAAAAAAAAAGGNTERKGTHTHVGSRSVGRAGRCMRKRKLMRNARRWQLEKYVRCDGAGAGDVEERAAALLREGRSEVEERMVVARRPLALWGMVETIGREGQSDLSRSLSLSHLSLPYS